MEKHLEDAILCYKNLLEEMMKKKIYYFMLGLAFLLSAGTPVYAETADECASRCVYTCSSQCGQDDTCYVNCLNPCVERCHGLPTDIPEAPAPSPASNSSKKGDGAACSSDDECKGECEGGSCCTPTGDPCNEYSHCCGHPSQGCTNGTCP